MLLGQASLRLSLCSQQACLVQHVAQAQQCQQLVDTQMPEFDACELEFECSLPPAVTLTFAKLSPHGQPKTKPNAQE